MASLYIQLYYSSICQQERLIAVIHTIFRKMNLNGYLEILIIRWYFKGIQFFFRLLSDSLDCNTLIWQAFFLVWIFGNDGYLREFVWINKLLYFNVESFLRMQFLEILPTMRLWHSKMAPIYYLPIHKNNTSWTPSRQRRYCDDEWCHFMKSCLF